MIDRSKPRDFFGLYFILRAGLTLLSMKKEEILRVMERLEPVDIKQDLKRFLPKSMRPILKNFKENLIREVERAL